MKRSLSAAAIFGLVVAMFFSLSCGRDATVRLSHSQLPVPGTGSEVKVEVWTDDVANLGAFQFDVVYDTSIVGQPGASLGSFLESTGREVKPVGPDTTTGVGRVTYGAATTGPNINGPKGSGILATVRFRGLAAGTASLKLEQVLLIDVEGKPIDYQIKETSAK